ncbi:inositol-phosphate phosphatase [Burkholderia sp. JP2-270]|nr:inositol-phosphate phosphatase [Burkholderia sp. JP2-270]
MFNITNKFPEHEARQYLDAMLKPTHDAGKLARRRFFSEIRVSEKMDFWNIAIDVHGACENLLINGIHGINRSHAIHSKRTRTRHGASDWSWIVDPLDGIPNYISAIPLFGVTLTLCYAGEPVAAILYDAYQDETVHGIRGGLIFHNHTPLRDLRPDASLGNSTIGWTQGYAVRHDPVARQVRDVVEQHSNRLLATGSHAIDTIKIATGKFGGIVSFDADANPLCAARVIVPALGGKVTRFSRGGEDRRFIIGASPYVTELSVHIRQAINE